MSGRYYANFSMTVYANSEGEAEKIAERIALELPNSDEHAGLQLEDIEADSDNGEGES